MNDERALFSRRLADALRAAGYEARPGVLHKLFNTRYGGPSVTSQTVSRWLGGRAIPEQDKLQVLARLLGVTPHYLRFGDVSGSVSLGEEHPVWANELNAVQWKDMQAYLALPGNQQMLIGALIRELGKTRSVTD